MRFRKIDAMEGRLEALRDERREAESQAERFRRNREMLEEYVNESLGQ